MSQVWFGNPSLANEFAVLVGTSLGIPTFNIFGPLFSWAEFPSFFVVASICCPVCNAALELGLGFNPANHLTYATATQVTTSVPEPGTLSLLGPGVWF